MTYNYNSGIGNYCNGQCPPTDAQPANGIFYRSVDVFPASLSDFSSDIETNKPQRKKDVCEHWGCSLWPSEKAARHARKLFSKWLTKKFIVCGQLTPTDGQTKLTPTDSQDEHTTFWKVVDLDVSKRFSIFLKPGEPA